MVTLFLASFNNKHLFKFLAREKFYIFLESVLTQRWLMSTNKFTK